jgi:beta-mannosidase
MYPHRIRLDGPWQFEPIERTALKSDGSIQAIPGPVPPAGRMKMPATWVHTPLHGFRGRVLFRRRFHAPRSIEPHEHLWLVFHGIDYFAGISLNGTSLGHHQGYFDSFEFEITPLVRSSNDLEVTIDCPAEPDPGRPMLLRAGLELADPTFCGGMWRGTVLEVRSFAFLHDVSVRAVLDGCEGTVAVAGTILGVCDGPVELNLSVNGIEFARRRIEQPAGHSQFNVEAALGAVGAWWPSGLGSQVLYDVKLDLHGAARTLDSFERRIGFRSMLLERADRMSINGRNFPVRWVDVESGQDPLCQDTRSFPGMLDSSDADMLCVNRVRGRVVSEQLYEWSDVHGRLLFQEFPGWAGLPSSLMRSDVESEMVRQARAMVRLLGHHASVVGWGVPHGADSIEGNDLVAPTRGTIIQADPDRVCW